MPDAVEVPGACFSNESVILRNRWSSAPQYVKGASEHVFHNMSPLLLASLFIFPTQFLLKLLPNTFPTLQENGCYETASQSLPPQ